MPPVSGRPGRVLNKIRISASILSADFGRLADELRAAEEAGCDEIHFDVMDGRFVPNITMGVPVLESVRAVTRLPIDVHMMVHEPSRFCDAFANAGADIFTVHVEACADVATTISAARQASMRPAVSLKPATPLADIQDLLGLVDRVLVMSVEPGFGGQPFMPEALPKIEALRAMAREAEAKIEIAVDGGIKADTIGPAVTAGAETLISGSGVFDRTGNVRAAVQSLRAAIPSRPV